MSGDPGVRVPQALVDAVAASQPAAADGRRAGAARPEVAVVMATYRRPELLRRCLEALLAQSFAADAYEIVVVDDGRTDDTRELVEAFAARSGGAPALRYLRPLDTRGPAGARNRGWRATAAPLVAFTDDDTVPDRDWLLEGHRAMTPDRVAVSGAVIVPVDGAPTDHAKMTQGLEAAEFVTANAFVRRDALLAVGGFDERFTRAWREDSDLHFSLLERGGTVVRAPAAKVLHPVRPAPWGISLGQQANVYFDALLYKKHRRLYLQKVRSRPPWHYFVIVGSTLAAPAALAAGAPAAAAAFGATALAGFAGFAAYRLAGTSRAPRHVVEMVVTSFAIPFLATWWRVAGALRFRALFP